MSSLIINDQLQAIYFENRDIVTTANGLILAETYSNPNIEKVKELIYHDKTLENGRFFGQNLSVQLTSKAVIDATLTTFSSERAANKTQKKIPQSQGAKLLVKYLQKGVLEKASDLHFEVYRDCTLILARIDGVRYEIGNFPDSATGTGIISYLLLSGHAKDKDTDYVEKDINNANIEQTLQVKDRLDDGAEHINSRNTIWRLGYIPSPEGGKMTLRWLNQFTRTPTLQELHYEPIHTAIFKRFLTYPSGVLLMGGVTGSGKTTTIAAVINLIDTTAKAVHTLEDPIEMQLPRVMQTLIRPNYAINSKSDKKQTQAELSKALLRHDTDAEMHSEVRDNESGMQVSSKGETGQLIFSTIHVSSGAGTAPRLIEMMHIPKELVAAPNLMRLWVYQALVRKVCPHCHFMAEDVLANPSEHDCDIELLTYFKDKHADHFSSIKIRNPNGCAHCRGGESGRLPVVEMIVLDDDDRAFFLRRDYQGWKQHLISKGFKSVRDHAIARILRGEVDPMTANQVLTEKIIEPATSTIYAEIAEGFEVNNG